MIDVETRHSAAIAVQVIAEDAVELDLVLEQPAVIRVVVLLRELVRDRVGHVCRPLSAVQDGEVVVEAGRLTKVDEAEVLQLATQARLRLDPSIARAFAAAKTMEPSLTEMYFRVFGQKTQ